jgi:hypothetical protein
MKEMSEIDKNFSYGNKFPGKTDLYRIPDPRFSLYGVKYYEGEGFLRMPLSVAKEVSDNIEILAHHTSGGRLFFKTNSKLIGIRVRYKYLTKLSNAELSASGFVLIEEIGENRKYVKILPPSFNADEGYNFVADVSEYLNDKDSDEMRSYILYFPICQRVAELAVELEEGSRVERVEKYGDTLPFLYYGSSVTEGFCAGRADNTYEAFIEKWTGVDFINLGFSGNGKGEDRMIEYLSGIKCSVFVCDYNHSGIDLDYFERQIEKLYRSFRGAQPTTPILFMSKTCIFTDKDRLDNANSDKVIRHVTQEKIIYKTYSDAVAAGDKNVYFLSGIDMLQDLTPTDRMSAANDADHLNELGFYIMAKKIL